LKKEEYIDILNRELIQEDDESKSGVINQFFEDLVKGFRGGKK
jgi:hypothetical protein